jgi:phosphoglycerate-specific signal transduction histidine kinase
MESLDLSQIKNDFSSFFRQIQDLVSDNNRFKEIIEDYIDCKHTIDKMQKNNDKKSKQLLGEYVSILNDLETEIYSHLKKYNSNLNWKLKRRK